MDQLLDAIRGALAAAIHDVFLAGTLAMALAAVTGIQPWLTPLAAAGLAVVMLFAIVFHIPRREYSNIVFNLILLALAVFVSYGRFALVS